MSENWNDTEGEMYTVIKQETLKESVRQKDRQKIRQKRFSEPQNCIDRSPGRHRDGATHRYTVFQKEMRNGD